MIEYLYHHYPRSNEETFLQDFLVITVIPLRNFYIKRNRQNSLSLFPINQHTFHFRSTLALGYLLPITSMFSLYFAYSDRIFANISFHITLLCSLEIHTFTRSHKYTSIYLHSMLTLTQNAPSVSVTILSFPHLIKHSLTQNQSSFSSYLLQHRPYRHMCTVRSCTHQMCFMTFWKLYDIFKRSKAQYTCVLLLVAHYPVYIQGNELFRRKALYKYVFLLHTYY